MLLIPENDHLTDCTHTISHEYTLMQTAKIKQFCTRSLLILTSLVKSYTLLIINKQDDYRNLQSC